MRNANLKNDKNLPEEAKNSLYKDRWNKSQEKEF